MRKRQRELEMEMSERLIDEKQDLVEDGGTVIGDDDIAVGRGKHLVHAARAEAGAHRIRHSLGCHDVGVANVILALRVHVLLRIRSSFRNDCHGWLACK